MSAEPISKFDPEKAKLILADAQRWAEKKKTNTVSEFQDAKAALLETFARLPESVEIPYDKTPEGERFAAYRRVCDPNFFADVDPTRIRNKAAFSRVAEWDGRFPGPCITGISGAGKTFAAWQALRRLYVKENRAFRWFPVRLLVTELERYEKNECAADFFRQCSFFRVLFIDDVDKINWDFESHAQMLFSFFDWVYSHKIPCIATTNRDQAWWKAKAGDALVRRMFVDGCVEVKF